MNMFKKTFLSAAAILLVVVSLSLPGVSRALTYTEVVTGVPAVPGQILGNTTPSPDVNGDGVVNTLDFVVLINYLGQNYAPADLNSDGIVNSLDFSILSAQWFAVR